MFQQFVQAVKAGDTSVEDSCAQTLVLLLQESPDQIIYLRGDIPDALIVESGLNIIQATDSAYDEENERPSPTVALLKITAVGPETVGRDQIPGVSLFCEARTPDGNIEGVGLVVVERDEFSLYVISAGGFAT